MRIISFHSCALALLLVACSTTPNKVPVNQTNTESANLKLNNSSKALDLKLCALSVSNPPANVNRRVTRDSAYACVQGVELLVAPAPNACMTSGFGRRNGRLHAGLDYQSKPAGAVVAAADGKVESVSFRQKDYGHWVVISHSENVHTGYAHFASIANNIKPGAIVRSGQTLGTMGSTGNATRAIHLHVEYRTGNINNPKRWFGLKPLNPFNQPAQCPFS